MTTTAQPQRVTGPQPAILCPGATAWRPSQRGRGGMITWGTGLWRSTPGQGSGASRPPSQQPPLMLGKSTTPPWRSGPQPTTTACHHWGRRGGGEWEGTGSPRSYPRHMGAPSPAPRTPGPPPATGGPHPPRTCRSPTSPPLSLRTGQEEERGKKAVAGQPRLRWQQLVRVEAREPPPRPGHGKAARA
ncbi:unnamed protein product, partial [Discosporangium mesarthrocarpum]